MFSSPFGILGCSEMSCRDTKMHCPHCAAGTTAELTKHTQVGYRTYRSSACQRHLNERTGSPYNSHRHRAANRAVGVALQTHPWESRRLDAEQ